MFQTVWNFHSWRCKHLKFFLTELLADDILCVCVIFSGQDGPYWPLEVEIGNYNLSYNHREPWYTQLSYLDRLWDLINILRFDDSPQVILQNFSEVVLQLRTSEVGQDLLPIWRTLEHRYFFVLTAAKIKFLHSFKVNKWALQKHGWLAPVILTSYLPRLGFCFPARIFRAVDLPIPLVPTSPSTPPGRGIGSLHTHVSNHQTSVDL